MSKNYFFLLLLVLIFFIPVFLRPVEYTIAGADSYYFLNLIQHKSTYDDLTTFVTNFIFNIIPNNVIIIKIIMLVLTFLSLLIFYETIKLKYPKASIFGCFVLLSVFLYSQVFFRLEDDLVAMPLLMLSLFFLTKYIQPNEKEALPLLKSEWYVILSIITLGLACIIWKFCVFFIIVYLFLSGFNKFYVILNLFLAPMYILLINNIIPTSLVSENIIGVGFFVVLCFLWVYLDFKNIDKRYKWPILIFSVCMVLNLKMLFAIVPVLALATVDYFERSNKYQKYIIVICYVCLFVGAINYSMQDFPNSNDYKMLELAKAQAQLENKELMVNWGYGYYAINQNIDANYFGHYDKQDPTGKMYYTNLTDKTVSNCKKIEKGKRVIIVSC